MWRMTAFVRDGIIGNIINCRSQIVNWKFEIDHPGLRPPLPDKEGSLIVNLLDAEVVAVAGGDFGFDEAARVVGAVFDDAGAVDVGGLAVIAAKGESIMNFVDQNGQSAADLGIHLVKDDFLLKAHQLVDAAIFDLVGNLIGQCGGGGVQFRVEGETAQGVEFRGFDKVQQFGELLIGFAGVADDGGGSQGHVRHGETQLVDELYCVLFGIGPPHGFEDIVVDMLDGHVDIVDDFVTFGDGPDEGVVDAGRIQVHQANPFQGGELFQFVDELDEAVFELAVPAVIVAVLGDEVQLDGAESDQFLRLVQDHVRRFAAEAAADGGDGAEGALTVAAFADTQVGPVLRGNEQA